MHCTWILPLLKSHTGMIRRVAHYRPRLIRVEAARSQFAAQSPLIPSWLIGTNLNRGASGVFYVLTQLRKRLVSRAQFLLVYLCLP